MAVHLAASRVVRPMVSMAVHPTACQIAHSEVSAVVRPVVSRAVHPAACQIAHPKVAVHPEVSRAVHPAACRIAHPEVSVAVHPEVSRVVHPAACRIANPEVSAVHVAASRLVHSVACRSVHLAAPRAQWKSASHFAQGGTMAPAAFSAACSPECELTRDPLVAQFVEVRRWVVEVAPELVQPRPCPSATTQARASSLLYQTGFGAEGSRAACAAACAAACDHVTALSGKLRARCGQLRHRRRSMHPRQGACDRAQSSW